jgi:hypothetical protein
VAGQAELVDEVPHVAHKVEAVEGPGEALAGFLQDVCCSQVVAGALDCFEALGQFRPIEDPVDHSLQWADKLEDERPAEGEQIQDLASHSGALPFAAIQDVP